MKLFVHFLLISSLPIIIGDGFTPLPTESYIESIIKNGDQSYITRLPEFIKLSEGGQISRNTFVVVWEGTYKDTVDVAIKISNIDRSFESEIESYGKLDAANNDFDFETHRIPRVYHNGTIFGVHQVIVMTLCGETLKKRFELQGGKFSDSTILLIFTQLVGILEYLHNKGVLHNAIKAENIFIRGNDVFIGDFTSSHLPNKPYSDYKSVMQLVWELAGANERELDSWSHCNRKYILDPDVHEAFKYILKIRYLYAVDYSRYITPDFENTIKAANRALAEIGEKSAPVQFDWLRKVSQGSKKSSQGFFWNRFTKDLSDASTSHSKKKQQTDARWMTN